MNRRALLQLAAAGLTVWHLPAAAKTNALHDHFQKKFIWVMLRGGMDSLHAILPMFDEDLMRKRASLVEPIQKMLRPLDGGFALHPKLEFFHTLYKRKQFAPVVAVSTPYRKRSHFNAQDLLEGGRAHIEYKSGWLGRAIEQKQTEGIAIARSVPLSLRSQATARTWYPSNLPDADDDLYQRLMGLYEDDDLLKQRLAQAIETNSMMDAQATKGKTKLPVLAKSCATILNAANSPQCAMLEMGGWDSHNNQVGRLARQFAELDKGIQVLHDELGPRWEHTVVVIATEFGRTVKNNGTKGTDHGTASAMFLAGGAIKGGRVLGAWPGLSDANLYEGRDLMPTSDTFGWSGALLQQHWGLDEASIAQVFPDSKPMQATLV